MKKYLLLTPCIVAFCALKADEGKIPPSTTISTSSILPTTTNNGEKDTSKAPKQARQEIDDNYDIDNTIPRPTDAAAGAAADACQDLREDQEEDLRTKTSSQK